METIRTGSPGATPRLEHDHLTASRVAKAEQCGPLCDPKLMHFSEASCAIFRISAGVVDPETVAITNSRSKEAFDRPCDETRSRSRALWQDANRMAIGKHALHQFSLSVRKRGDRADFDKMYARYTPGPHGRTRMIVFPLRRSVGFKAATASSRVETLRMFVRSRRVRRHLTLSLNSEQ